MNKNPPELFFFGPGKLGLSLCLLFERAGIGIIGVWGRRAASVREAQRWIKKPIYYGPIPGEVSDANVVFITTQDGAIEEVANELEESGNLTEGTAVYHCGGAVDSSILYSLRRSGAITGTIHPLQTIPTVEAGLDTLPRSCFSVEGDERAISIGRDLVESIGGKSFELPGGDRGLYHASAAMASNYMITLFSSAVKMMMDTGLSEDEATRALKPMLKNVVDGIERIGVRKALTGPILRGDVQTLKIQLEAISKNRPDDLSLFIAMASHTVDLVREIGGIDAEGIETMRDLLNRYNTTIL
jgi:predicted short-subunit dehydrogenase-like oxidoreductase (DUF2520 family)